MPVNSPSTNTHRTTRSGSNPAVLSLQDIRSLIESSKSEIMKMLSSEIGKLNELTSTLLSRVDELQNSNQRLERECSQLKEEVVVLKRKNLDYSEEIIEEAKRRIERRNFLIVSGLPEHEIGTPNERKQKDIQMIESILGDLNAGVPNISNASRIGIKRGSQTRLLRFECTSNTQRTTILKTARNLKNSTQFSHIYIRPDLTPKQIEMSAALRREMKQRRANGENVWIQRGRIVSDDQTSPFR